MASTYVVRVVPDASGWSARLTAQIDPVTRAIADNLRRELQRAVRDGLSGTGINARGQGSRMGRDFSDAFARITKSRIEAALRSLPTVQIGVATSEAEQRMRDLSARLKQLGEDIELGVDDKKAILEIDNLKREIAALARNSPDVRVRVNTGTALAELEALKRSLGSFDRKNGLTRWLDDLRSKSQVFDKVAGGAAGLLSSATPSPATLGLLAAVVAALSTIGPLAAAASGAMLGIAGTVGTVALAYKGLKRDFETGGGITRYLKGQITDIKGELSGLAQDAGRIIAPFAHDLLDGVRRALPGFAPIVKFISGQLGNAGADLGATLISAAQQAQPLFADVAHYIEIGAQKLRDWVASPSFGKFLDYARQQLPILIGYVGDFGKALVDLFVGLAPTGEGILKLLSGVAKAISAISNAGLFTGGGSLIGKLFGSDGDKKKADQTTGYIDDLLVSMRRLGDTSDETYSRVRIAASATTQAFLDATQGFDAQTATLSATTGVVAAAFTALRGDLLNYTSTMLAADSATQSVAKSIHDNLSSVGKDGTLLGQSYVDASGKFVAANGQFTEGSSAIAQALQAQTKAATDAAAQTYQHELATKGDVRAAQDALTVYKGYRQSLIDQAVQSGLTTDKAKALADQYFAVPDDVSTFVDLLGSENVGLAIKGLTDALNRLSTIIAAPAVALQDAQFQSSLKIANSDLDYFGNRKPIPSLDLSTGAFDQGAAKSNGVLDVLGKKTASPTVTLNDQASGKLGTIQYLLSSLHDKSITITTVQRLVAQTAAANNADRTGAFSAAGNLFVPYAAGGIAAKLAASVPSFASGIEKHVPQIASARAPFRVWAEPETKGEAYIPLANDWRRSRAQQIWMQTGKRIGMVPSVAAAPSSTSAGGGRTSGSDLLGVSVTIDAGSVGTLTGHVTAVADSRIAVTSSTQALASSAGSGSVIR